MYHLLRVHLFSSIYHKIKTISNNKCSSHKLKAFSLSNNNNSTFFSSNYCNSSSTYNNSSKCIQTLQIIRAQAQSIVIKCKYLSML